MIIQGFVEDCLYCELADGNVAFELITVSGTEHHHFLTTKEMANAILEAKKSAEFFQINCLDKAQQKPNTPYHITAVKRANGEVIGITMSKHTKTLLRVNKYKNYVLTAIVFEGALCAYTNIPVYLTALPIAGVLTFLINLYERKIRKLSLNADAFGTH